MSKRHSDEEPADRHHGSDTQVVSRARPCVVNRTSKGRPLANMPELQANGVKGTVQAQLLRHFKSNFKLASIYGMGRSQVQTQRVFHRAGFRCGVTPNAPSQISSHHTPLSRHRIWTPLGAPWLTLLTPGDPSTLSTDYRLRVPKLFDVSSGASVEYFHLILLSPVRAQSRLSNSVTFYASFFSVPSSRPFDKAISS
jgi:hypothetical protein